MKIIQKINEINDWIAVKTILGLGTMACVYLFTIWAVVPLWFPSTRDFVFYVSGGILQLSLLPLILVGQNILSQSSEKRAEEDHEAVMEIVKDIHEMMEGMSDIKEVNERLKLIESKIKMAKDDSVP